MVQKVRKEYRDVELLAPAGSFSCMKAAYQAGADAVYAGGSMFGARASAENFQKEELISAIEYAHLRQKKFFLTVNTLLKEQELESKLYDYLQPLYESGLDAVIVQDLGVLSFVRREFPDLPVHASTQLNTTGPFFAKELKRLGVTRIVTARELSLDEISDIYRETGLEIESFIHGALCYCYSGQCLLSSLIGGRSGNRGRCAQPCRLAYDLLENGKRVNAKDNRYLFSPKDLCSLELLPEMIESGVYSLKIEGRMKKPEYVASVTSMYRKYLDLYLEQGKEQYHVKEEDVRLLKEIYNRGGFTQGYYKQHNGMEMMSPERPGHRGVQIGEIAKLDKQSITIRTSIALKKGDVLEFDLKNGSCNYTIGEEKKGSSVLSIRNKFQNGFAISSSNLKSDRVFRMRNESLIKELHENYLEKEDKILISGRAVLETGKPALLELWRGDILVSVEGEMVQEAQKQPVTKADIREKLTKTGATPFAFEHLDICCGERIFYPAKQLNELRRAACAALEQACQEPYRRNRKQEKISYPVQENRKREERKSPAYSILVSTKEQFDCVVECDVADRIYLETALFSYEDLEEILSRYENKGTIYLALPYIFRKQASEEFKRMEKLYTDPGIAGYVIRNLETYFFLKENYPDIFQKKFIFDNQIYCYNKEAYSYLTSLKADVIGYSRELNGQELEEQQITNGELDLYGYIPAMITAGCVKKNYAHCDGISSVQAFQIQDRTGEHLFISNVCRYCYNVIYYSKPLSLFEEKERIACISPNSLRISFTQENREECKHVLAAVGEWKNDGKKAQVQIPGSKEHFRRGVM